MVAEQEDGVIKINEMLSTEIVREDSGSVKYQVCKTNANIHNHPNGACELSKADAYSFGFSRNLVNGIICGPNKFVFFHPTDLDVSTEVVII